MRSHSFVWAISSLLIAASFAVAGRAAAASGWTRVQTPNFELVGDAPEADIRAIGERLERFRSAIESVLPTASGTVRTRVVVFKDAASFAPFKPKRPDGSPDDSIKGLFLAGDEVSYIALTAAPEDLDVIYHEYVHDRLGGLNLPAWLNEGLAEFFQTFRVTETGRAAIGVAQPGQLTALRRGPMVPWDEFFALDNFTLHQSADASRGVFYAQAWAVTAYLISKRASGAAIDPESLLHTFRDTPRADLDAGVRALIADPGPAERAITARIAFSSAAPAKAVEQFAVSAVLGELLYRLRDEKTAEGLLKDSISLQPKQAAAHSVLGQLKLRQRKFAEAKQHLARAVAHPDADGSTHFHYAFALLQEKQDEAGMIGRMDPAVAAEIRRALRRSTELNPGLPESFKLLAILELAQGDDIRAADVAAAAALRLRPHKEEYSLLVAEVRLRQERFDDAFAIAQPLAVGALDMRVRSDARALLKALDEIGRSRRSPVKDAALKVNVAGMRQPVILQRRDLTDAEVARIDRERDNYNLNVLIDRAREGEREAVGSIENIACADDRIVFRIKTQTGELRLSTQSFEDIRFRVVVPGVRSYAFRCDSALRGEKGVFVYRTEASGGRLVAISFVPESFRLMTRAEMIDAPFIIIEGRSSGDISQNEKLAAAERATMEREMRETQIRDITDRLRELEIGDSRMMGVTERLECADGKMKLYVRSQTGGRVFETPILKAFDLRSFRSDTGFLERGCGASMPTVEAVITYRNNTELLAVEYVPTFYRLP